MKKINFKGISEILSENEMKKVMGGSNMYEKESMNVMSGKLEFGDDGYLYTARCTAYTGSDLTFQCHVSFDNCLNVFVKMCPSGGFFY
jgi:hypothetical protein